jgi:hypothetical protein
MTNACMNLILFKFRQQYGLRLFTQICLTAFVVTCAAHLAVDNYESTLFVRAVAGMAAGLALGFGRGGCGPFPGGALASSPRVRFFGGLGESRDGTGVE